MNYVFPDVTKISHGRYILTVTNFDADKINAEILQKIIESPSNTGICRSYYSVDSIADDDTTADINDRFPVEYLNSLRPSGLPPHHLRLITGMPVMLLRN